MQNIHQLKGTDFVLNIMRDRCLGEGSYGSVYQCYIEGQEHNILAVKIIPVSSLSQMDCINQIVLLSELPPHPNIISVLRYSIQSETNVYYVMEKCQQSLQDLIEQRDLSEIEIVTLFKDMINGLVHLAAHDLLHQDIKPANILRSGGSWKFGDFGVALNIRKMPVPKNIHGTLIYTAPEKLRQNYCPDINADIFALGIVMYQIIALRHPFLPKHENVDQLTVLNYYKMLMKSKPKHPCLLKRLPPLTSKIAGIVMRMIVPNPSIRISLVELHELINGGELKQIRLTESYSKQTALLNISQIKKNLVHISTVDIKPIQLDQDFNAESAQKCASSVHRMMEYLANELENLNSTDPRNEQVKFLCRLYAVKVAEIISIPGQFMSSAQIFIFLEDSKCKQLMSEISKYAEWFREIIKDQRIHLKRGQIRKQLTQLLRSLIEEHFRTLSTSMMERSRPIMLLNLLQLKKIIEAEPIQIDQLLDDNFYRPREYLSMAELLNRVIEIGDSEGYTGLLITIEDDDQDQTPCVIQFDQSDMLK